jgi:hypothetical protein
MSPSLASSSNCTTAVCQKQQHHHGPEQHHPSPAASRASSLSQLLDIRDEKRKTLRRLFDEKKRIQQQMDDMNEELVALDDQIEALEEDHLQEEYNHNTSTTAAAAADVVHSYVKYEQDLDRAHQIHTSDSTLMTMNVEEILTEQPLTILTQQHEQQPDEDEESKQRYGEQLTDPITWTQTQEVTPPTLHHHQYEQQQHQHGYNDNDDGDPDDNDELEIVYTNNRSLEQTTTPAVATTSRQQQLQRVISTAYIHPLQVVPIVDRNSTSTSSTGRGTGTLDSFLLPNTSRPAISTLATTFAATATNAESSSSSAFHCPFSQNDIVRELNRSFHIQSFRENQLEVIQSTLSGKDCFVLMKTGGGKSLVSSGFWCVTCIHDR